MYLVVESIDGGGSTTQSKLLAEALKAQWSCRPSKSDLGELIRATLKGERMHSHESLAHLFLADHLESEVREVLLYEGTLVLDRWITSTFAYQRDVINWQTLLEDVLAWMTCPTAIIYLKIDPEVALQRVSSRGEPLEKFEKLETLKKVAQNYEDIFVILKEGLKCRLPENEEPIDVLPIWTFDSTLPIEEIHKQIMEKVRTLTEA